MARPKKVVLFALVWFVLTRDTSVINLDQVVDKTKRREGETTDVLWSVGGKKRTKYEAKIIKISGIRKCFEFRNLR